MLKDTQIIGNFKSLERAINQSHGQNQKQIQQLVQYVQQMSITMDALINSIVERGILSGKEMSEAIQKEVNRREEAMHQQKANDLGTQPVIETDGSGPTVEADTE